MKFSDQHKSVTETSNSFGSGLHKEVLMAPVRDWGKEKNTSLYTLWEGIIDKDLMYSVEDYLGKTVYENSCSYAVDALKIAFHPDEIYGKKIDSWTKESLKTFDGVLIHYVQETLGEKIIQRTSKEKETDVYVTLASLVDEKDKQIGENFKYVYQLRSDMEHLQVTTKDGKRKQRKMSTSKYNTKRDNILRMLKTALSDLLERLRVLEVQHIIS